LYKQQWIIIDDFETGDYMQVYQCNYHLAKYFQSTGDQWLADHFYKNCLNYSVNVMHDDGKVAAESHCNVGICLEEAGNTFYHTRTML